MADRPSTPHPIPLPPVFVAPTEPVRLRAIGKTSLTPERLGVDVCWVAAGKKWGVQRKEWKDLVASVEDGRWGREIPMMVSGCDVAWVMVEGWPRVTTDGALLDKSFGRPWTEQGVRKVLWGAQMRGVQVTRSNDLGDTVSQVLAMVEWSCDPNAGKSAVQRPGPTGMWGHKNDRDWGVHLLQGLEGVGVELAGRIFDVRGEVPWQWTVTEDELCQVKGIGKKKARKILDALGGVDDA